MPAVSASKYRVDCGLDQVPHISEEEKKRLFDETPPYLRDARLKGIPSQGAGAIYPVEEDVYLCDPFALPHYWPKVFGLDVGWNRTAAIWAAHDRETGTVYLYSEHYLAREEPSIQAAAIKARGEWIPGVIDPAARGRSQIDGRSLIEEYRENGLNLHPANNAVEAGIHAVWERLSTGKLKIFRSLQNWRNEVRFYHRDDNGKIVKTDDHLMDATRYLILSGLDRAIVKPVPRPVSGPLMGDRKAGY